MHRVGIRPFGALLGTTAKSSGHIRKTTTPYGAAKGLTPHPVGCSYSPMSPHPFSNLTPEQRATVDAAVANYRGFSDKLSAALGGLAAGYYFGWRGLLMVHDRSTIKKYEAILGLDFKECLPERTEHTDRLFGIRLADQLGKFWAVVKNEIAVPGGKAFMDDDGQGDMFGGATRGRSTK